MLLHIQTSSPHGNAVRAVLSTAYLLFGRCLLLGRKATEPAQVRQMIDGAIRIAKAEQTVTCVILPNDLREIDAVESPPHSHGSVFTGVGRASSPSRK